MIYLAATLSALSPLATGTMFLIFSSLGRRMGEALQMPRFYLLYWAGAIFFCVPVLVGVPLYFARVWGMPQPPELTVYKLKALVLFLPMCIGSSMAFYASVRYWNWVWPELRSNLYKPKGR